MHRRIFVKSLVFLLASFPLKILSFSNKKLISFDYSVASGDPTNTHVILWTKITPLKKKKYSVRWEVSTDLSFTDIIVEGISSTGKQKNYVVKVDAYIPQEYNGKRIFYRFISEGIISDTGITSTLPTRNPDIFNIAFCSCSNYPAGYFNAYKEMANDKEIDLVLHLGDYIYEYSRNGYASSDAKEMGRVVDPPNEIISLDDYRRRFATYRRDKDLQSLHRNKPMIAVWDDHEITNDAWKEGAQNHNFGEGSFSRRKKNALKAYYEWMPIRDTKQKQKIWRDFSVGNLINLLMLDTRLYGREKQLDISTYIKNGLLDKKQYKEDLFKPRDLLGKEQLNWLDNKVKKTYRWSIFGQQLLIGPKYLPSIFKSDEFNSSASSTSQQLAGEKLAINTDQWDGYPVERQKLYKIIAKSQANIVLAGDSHNSWFSNLYDDDENFVGVEIGAPAISSPSLKDTYGEFTEIIEKSFIEENDGLIWVNGSHKGYTSLAIHKDYIDVSYKYVSTVKSKDYRSLKPYTFRVEHNKPYT